MIVSVTQQHIRDGIKGSPRLYPIALALRDAGLVRPSVGTKEVTLGPIGGHHDDYPLSQSAQKFIQDYDAGRPVKPIRIIIDVSNPIHIHV